jgi:hypothetical protein
MHRMPMTQSDVGREVGMLLRGASRAHLTLRNRIANLVMLTLIIDVAGTTAAWLLERHDPHTGFTTWAGALFWTTTQLTTVSSQLPNPVTPGGKALDVVLQLWGICFTVTLAASVFTFFLRRHHERMQAQS